MTVTNEENQPVASLMYNGFQVFEDDKQQVISYFDRGPLRQEHLRIGVLIDTSGRHHNKLPVEGKATVDFLNTTLRPPKDMAFIVALDNAPRLVQDYSSNTKERSEAILNLPSGGQPRLYDAVYYASKEKLFFVPPPEPYLRRVLIMISAGVDKNSEHTLDEAIAMARRAEVKIYAISPGHSDAHGQVLRRLADETGGLAFFPSQASKVAASFEAVSEDLKSQYLFAYISSNNARDGTYRAITVKPLNRGLRIRAKPGYFAPSQ
jgi:VWFA-related protein